MAFKLKYIPLTLFVVINILFVVAMNLSAYSAYLPPQTYPNVSYWGLLFPIFLVANVLFVFFWLTFKRRFMLISIVGMSLCAWAVRAYIPININKEVPKDALKILSYNVMMFADDANYPWEEKSTVRYLQESGADIICLQEIGWIDTALEQGLLKMEEYPYRSMRVEKHMDIGCLSKYPIVNVRKIEYESRSNRSYAYDIVIGNDTVIVVNNHMESYKLQAEDKAQYKELINATKETEVEEMYDALTDKLIAANRLRGPQTDSIAAFVRRNIDRYPYMIVCGDLNDSPISYTHNTLTGCLNDAYTRTGNGPGLSYNRSGMYFRLDHILVSDSITPYKTVVDHTFGRSDHYPIYSYVGLNREK